MVVAVCEPHLFSLETIPKLNELLSRSGNPTVFYVVNKVATQESEGQNAAEFIRSEGYEVCPHIIYQRAVHKHATNIGKIASEYEPNGKAAGEVLQVYTYTCKTSTAVEESKCQT